MVGSNPLGGVGERAAARHAWLRGARILARNYSVRGGEVDLVLAHGGELVFGEVKTRTGGDVGVALDAVTTTKQRRILRAAQGYLREHRVDPEVRLRFDVFSVTPGRWWSRVVWVRDAFRPDCG